MVKVDTAPENDVRENEADSFDPAQQHYDEEFNKIAQAETDKDFDQIIDDNYGGGASDEKIDAHGDKVQRNYNSDAESASEKVKDQEENPDFMPGGDSGPKKGLGKFGKLLKKGGPTSGIAGLLLAGVMGSSLAGPAALVVMLEKIFTNANAHDVRGNEVMMKGRLGAIIASIGSDRDCSTSKIKCKVTEMSNSEKKRWEKAGIKIESDRSKLNPLRNKIRKMTATLPNGKTVEIKNAKQFNDLMRNNPDFKKMAWTAQHPKAAYFIGPDSKFRKILGKYGMKLSDVFKSSKAKDKAQREEENKKALNSRTGADTEGDKTSRLSKLKEKFKTNDKLTKVSGTVKEKMTTIGAKNGVGTGLGLAALPVETACLTYNLVRVASATIKVSYYTDLIKFFKPFMEAAAQIEDQGNIDPETVETIADRLTWYQNDEATKKLVDQEPDVEKKKVIQAKEGLTAMDSQGFQAALFGDHSTLTEFTKKYAPWYVTAGVALSSTIKHVQSQLGGKQNVRTACLAGKTLGYASLAANLAVGAATCIASAGADCVRQIFTTIGGAVAGYFLGKELVDLFLNEVTEEAAQRIIDAGLDADLKGVDLGNALAAGIGLFMMEKDRGSGLQPANSTSQIKKYLTMTDSSYNDYIAMEKEDAAATPFDTYNQYSFAGQLVAALNPYKTNNPTGFSILANLGTVVTSAFKLPGTTAYAGYSQPNELVSSQDTLDGSLARCEDQDMASIGALCDWTGRSIDIVDEEPLGWAQSMADGDTTTWDKVVDWMASPSRGVKDKDGKDVGYIDGDTGKPTNYDKYESDCGGKEEKGDCGDNEYLMYKAFCREDREYPLGTSISPIDDYGDGIKNSIMGWKDGNKCVGNGDDGKPDPALQKKLNYFFFYYNMCENQIPVSTGDPDTGEGGVENCWDDEKDTTTSAAGASLQSDGEWGCPVDPNKGGIMTQKPHDIGHGTASGVDYNYGKDTPGPIYAVRDGVVTQAGPASGYGNWVMIEHDENGKKISSYYGHIANGGYFVKVGQQVKKGDHIADIGAGIVGSSTGAHVHAGLKMDPQATAQDYETRFMAACNKS